MDEYETRQFFHEESGEINTELIRALIKERLEKDFNNQRIIFGTSNKTHLPKKHDIENI